MRHSLKIVALLLLAAPFCGPQATLEFPASHRVVTLSLPDQPAALQIDVLHMTTEKNTLKPDGTARYMFAHGGSWNISANVSPAQSKVDAAGRRDLAWKGLSNGPFKADAVRTYGQGKAAVLDYMIERFQGRDLHQKNVFAYLVSGDQWFDVHISKAYYDPGDEKFLNSMLSSVILIEHYQPDTQLEFGYGSGFYLQQNWLRASQHYERALGIERSQKKRSLSPAEWRVLVDNLGMAYGMQHDWEKAKATFQFGITQDPAYPMFHYNLACTYAELNDLDSALADLKSAFAYRRNGIPGEGMPDPTKDPSFARFVNDARFSRLARQVCPESQKTDIGFMCR